MVKDYERLGCPSTLTALMFSLMFLLPFRSKAQRRFLFAKHPRLARRFAKHTPQGTRLPEVKRKNKKRKKRTVKRTSTSY